MKRIALIVAVLVIAIAAARANDPDPLSVVQALMDAEQAFDLDRALSLFADDAMIVNVAGARTAGAEHLKEFLDADMWFADSFVLEQPVVTRNSVSWTKAMTGDFYRNLGIAPIRFAFRAVVDNGQIESIVAHVPQDEIIRIDVACRRRAAEPLIYGRPCSEFVRYLKNQANSASDSASVQKPPPTAQPN
jgi:RecA/RadA recombinase